MNNTPRLIAVLVIIAVAVGVLLVFWNVSPQSSGTDSQPSQTGATGAPGDQANSPTDPNTKKILTPPGPSASQAEKQTYSDLVYANAKVTTDLSIGPGCAVNPLVMQVEPDATISIRNTDTKEHVLYLDADHQVTVAPGASKNTSLSFFKAGLVYGYGCESNSGPIGMIIISE